MQLYAGTAIITNYEPLVAGEWTTAVAELNYREGSLVVNDGIASKGLFQQLTASLTLNLTHIHISTCRIYFDHYSGGTVF